MNEKHGTLTLTEGGQLSTNIERFNKLLGLMPDPGGHGKFLQEWLGAGGDSALSAKRWATMTATVITMLIADQVYAASFGHALETAGGRFAQLMKQIPALNQEPSKSH